MYSWIVTHERWGKVFSCTVSANDSGTAWYVAERIGLKVVRVVQA